MADRQDQTGTDLNSILDYKYFQIVNNNNKKTSLWKRTSWYKSELKQRDVEIFEFPEQLAEELFNRTYEIEHDETGPDDSI